MSEGSFTDLFVFLWSERGTSLETVVKASSYPGPFGGVDYVSAEALDSLKAQKTQIGQLAQDNQDYSIQIGDLRKENDKLRARILELEGQQTRDREAAHTIVTELFRHGGVEVIPADARKWVDMNRKIDGIKVLRQQWGVGLLEAKWIAEAYTTYSDEKKKHDAEAERLNALDQLQANKNANRMTEKDMGEALNELMRFHQDPGPTQAQVDAQREIVHVIEEVAGDHGMIVLTTDVKTADLLRHVNDKEESGQENDRAAQMFREAPLSELGQWAATHAAFNRTLGLPDDTEVGGENNPQ